MYKSTLKIAVIAIMLATFTLVAQEMLFFDMDKIVTESMGGFPRGNSAPSANNCDWTSPVDYTTGTVHIRCEIRSTPKAQCLKPSFGIWSGNAEAVSPNGGRPTVNITPDPDDITVVTASFPFSSWLEYGDDNTNWAGCRSTMGPVMKSCDGRFISNKSTWNWGGDDPADWYPMDMRFTCVVVSSGSTFSGWGTHISSLEVLEGSCTPSSISGESPEPITFSINVEGSVLSASLDLTLLNGPSEYAMTKGIGANWTANWQPPAGLNMGTLEIPVTALGSGDAWGGATITVDVRGALIEEFNSTNLDSWTIGQGSWTVADGSLQNSSEGRTSAWTGPLTGANLTFSADVTPVDDANVWMIFRVQDSLNYYLFTLGNFMASASTTGVGRLFKLDNGMYRMVAAATNANFTTGTKYSIKIEAIDDQFKVYSDDVLILEGNDTSY